MKNIIEEIVKECEKATDSQLELILNILKTFNENK